MQVIVNRKDCSFSYVYSLKKKISVRILTTHIHFFLLFFWDMFYVSMQLYGLLQTYREDIYIVDGKMNNPFDK